MPLGFSFPLNPSRTRMAQQLRHDSPFLGCRFDPSGRFVFAGAQDNTIQRWELSSGRKTALSGHRSWVRGLAFVPGGNTLIAGDYHGKLLWWPADAEAPRPVRTVDAHRGWVRAVAVSPNGQLLASCGNDNLVKLWDPRDGTAVRELRGHEHHVYNIAFHPRESFVVSCDLRGVVKQWDLATGRATRTFDASVLYRYDNTFRADIGGARSMAFSPDGTLLALCGITNVTNAFAGIGDPVVVLFDWQTGQRRQLLRPRVAFRGTAWGVVFHPSGFLVSAGGGNGGALWFWRPNEVQSFHHLTLPSNARDLDLHPDGRRLAIPFFDNSVRIYDMAG